MGAAEAGPSRRSTEGRSLRRLIVSSFLLLDGIIEPPMTWTSPVFDDESKEYAHTQLADVESFVQRCADDDNASLCCGAMLGFTDCSDEPASSPRRVKR